MKCETCSKIGEIFVEYTQISFCKKCYEQLLFKRLKKWFRNNNVIDKNKTHVLLDDGSLGFVFLKKFMEKFFSFPGLKWETRKKITSRMKNKTIILPTTLTNETNLFVDSMFNNEEYSFTGAENVFKPLTCVLDSDLLKWKRKRLKKDFPHVHSFVEEIVKRRPMARFSMIKHLEEFQF